MVTTLATLLASMLATLLAGEYMILAAIFWPMIAAILAYTLGHFLPGRKGGRIRDTFVLMTVFFSFAVSLLLALYHSDMELRLADFGALALHFRIDGFRALFGCVTAFLWLVTLIFSPEYFAHSRSLNRYWLFNLLTLGATMGVFFSADFRTTFLFFEIMSLTSYALVAHDESPAALRAAETYLAVAIMGGLAMLMGMLLLQQQHGTLEFAGLYRICAGIHDKSLLYLPGALLVVGFGAKAGVFPLHIWLPKAHPVAPAPASALLSGILIKTGVFGVAAVSSNIFINDYTWGVALLIPALITMLLGALLAVFSNDFKRTLACSSVSQIGFIITGIAMQVLPGKHNIFAVHGTLLHMFNHSLAKLVLFLAAGVVYMNRHELEFNRIRGFGRGKPLFRFVFLMAALTICGFPLFSGYISKTLLHESIVQAIYLYNGISVENFLLLTDAVFIFTGGLTFAYMAKLFAALFTGAKEATVPVPPAEKRYISRPAAIALTVSAALLPFFGSFTVSMDLLANRAQDFFHIYGLHEGAHYFSLKNLRSAAVSLAIGMAIYFLMVNNLLMHRKEGGIKTYSVSWPKWLDLENFIYRPLLKFIIRTATLFARIISALPTAAFRRPSWEDPVMIGAFSLNLLFAGAGICIALIYVFTQAFW